MSVIPDGFIRRLNWKDELEQMDKMRTKGICDSEIQKKKDKPSLPLKRILLNGNPATDEFTIRIRKKNKSPLLFFLKSHSQAKVLRTSVTFIFFSSITN